MVDVFRASATMCAMLNNGASAIIPVSNSELAKEYKSRGYLVGAERNTKRCEFADFGNSPFDYTPEKVRGKEIVFTTTNGTRAIDVASDCKELMIGTFPNIDAVVDKCMNSAERVIILCAGWNNRISIEDTLFGGAFAEKLLGKVNIKFDSDSIKMTYELWLRVKDKLDEYLKVSDHYQRLITNSAVGDVDFCITQNSVSIVPVYNKTDKKIY
jgi:2-phosphosulfolactate phosphatase